MRLSLRQNSKIIILLVLTTLAAGISLVYFTGSRDGLGSDDFPLSSWHSEYKLSYDNHEYDVTEQFTTDIGKMIEILSYHGPNPGMFRLYVIQGVDDFSKIAVETKDGYLIATRKEAGQ